MQTGEQGRVIVVDHDQRFGRSIQRMLADHTLDMSWARTGAELRSIVDELALLPARCALVADRLPDCCGLELLSLIEALPSRPSVALLSADLCLERALFAWRAGRALLPKPTTTTELDTLLGILVTQRARPFGQVSAPAPFVADFTLDLGGVSTSSGFHVLRTAELSLLRFLIERRGNVLSTPDIARALLGRHDRAAPELIRRHVANIRRRLGSHAWVVELVPGRGYRVAESARFHNEPHTIT